MAVLYAFFSYTHLERKLDPKLFELGSDELALRVSAQFANHELRVWKDDRIQTGEDWNEAIEANLRDSKLLIVMLSPKWLGSDYCRKEYAIFREVEKRLSDRKLIAPILVRDVKIKLTPEQQAIADDLSKRQYKSLLVTEFLELEEDERDLRIEQLTKELAKTLEPLFEAATVPIQPAPQPSSVVVAHGGQTAKFPLPSPPSPLVVTRRGGGLGGFLGWRKVSDALGNLIIGKKGGGPSVPGLENILNTFNGPEVSADFGADEEAAPKSAPASLPPHSLPLATIGAMFMGRDGTLEDIAATLKDRTALVLRGMGGVGKTRLAIEYAWKHAPDHSALLFVSAETPELLQTGLAALAATLNLPEKELPEDPPKREAVLRWLRENRGWLVILDNVDDEKAAAAVAELLPQLTAGKTLVTARYDGFPPGVPVLPLGVLKPEPARDFLLARTEGKRRGAADDAARAAELAEALGYLALALEQAGAFIATQRISFERYLAYWRDERARMVAAFDKVASGSIHEKGLSAVFATSVARLSANGRRLLDRIAFLAPEPIPEFLLDVEVPSLRAEGDAIQESEPDAGSLRSARDDGGDRPEAGEAPQEPSRSARTSAPADDESAFDARAALAELYAYSLAAPTEIEGRYAQPAFVVHRLVQDYARESMDEGRKDIRSQEALSWLNAAFDGDPGDVRNWSRFDPLIVHAVNVAEKAVISETTSRLLNQAAQVLDGQTRFAEAEPLMRRALAIDEECFGPDHPRVATNLNNLAGLLLVTERLAEAEPLFRRALVIDEKRYGVDHPEVATDLSNLAQLLQDTNRLAEAEPLIQRALVTDEKSFGPEHPKVAIRLNNLATLLQDMNRLAEAEPHYRRAVKIFAASLGLDHPNTQTVANNYRTLLRQLGASEEEAEAKVAAALRGRDA